MKDAQKRFEVMVNALSADLYRYAFWLCRSRDLAEDLVQETFMRAWRSFGNLRDERKAKSWLITTLRREYARQFERYQPDFAEVELDGLSSNSASTEDHAEVVALRRALASLPEKYRDPLALQVIAGYTGEEIGEMLNLPRATVMTRLFRARQTLQRVLHRENVAVEGVQVQ